MRPSDFLDSDIDFVKIDTAGTEVEVLVDCFLKLKSVKSICVEYHSYFRKEQQIDVTLRELRQAGFWYHIGSEPPSLRIKTLYGMDSV